MATPKSERVTLHSTDDIVRVRQLVRAFAVAQGLTLVDQTKIVTASSELARNAVVYAGGAEVLVEAVEANGLRGVRLTFEDHGPGIPDLELAMKDGYSTSGGLGLGLGGSRRLATEFDIWSRPGEGTRVTITRWT